MERRLFTRVDVDIPMGIGANENDQPQRKVHTRNLSFGGANIYDPQNTLPLKLGERISVNFSVPPMLSNDVIRKKQKIHNLEGTVINQTFQNNQTCYSLRFRNNLLDLVLGDMKQIPFSLFQLARSTLISFFKKPISFVVAVGMIVLIYFTKILTLIEGDWWVKLYSLLVVAFICSRIIASIIYEQSGINRWKVRQKLGYIPQYEPTVAFLIPVKNEEKVIEQTVMKCLEAHYPQEKFEIIVVDDGSTDKTWEIIQTLRFKNPTKIKAIRLEKNQGKRFAMTTGVEATNSEIIIQLDSDSFVDGKSMPNLIRPFFDAQVGAVAAHTEPINANENIFTRMQQAYYFMSFRLLKAAESCFGLVFCCSGCCSAYRRSSILPLLKEWKEEKFLNVKMNYGDDRALTNLVVRSGHETLYAFDVQAFTLVPKTLKHFLKQQLRWKKGWLINSFKAIKIIFRRDKFVAFTYFYPLILITLLTPIMAFRALIYNPIFNGILPSFYLFGIFFVTTFLVLHYNNFRNDGLGKYLYLWSFLNTFCFSFILFFALFNIRDNRWGTR